MLCDNKEKIPSSSILHLWQSNASLLVSNLKKKKTNTTKACPKISWLLQNSCRVYFIVTYSEKKELGKHGFECCWKLVLHLSDPYEGFVNVKSYRTKFSQLILILLRRTCSLFPYSYSIYVHIRTVSSNLVPVVFFCWTGLNWFMSHLSRATFNLHTV